MPQKLALPRGDAVAGIKCGSLAHPRRNALPRPRQNADRHRFHDLPPVLPKMKLRQIIRPHQPHEPDTRVARAQCRQGLGRIARAKMGLDIRDLHIRVLHHFAGMRHPLRKGRWPMVLERITRADHPPDTIQPEPLERLACDMCMPLMGGIK